jgi:hypothetical protein
MHTAWQRCAGMMGATILHCCLSLPRCTSMLWQTQCVLFRQWVCFAVVASIIHAFGILFSFLHVLLCTALQVYEASCDALTYTVCTVFDSVHCSAVRHTAGV